MRTNTKKCTSCKVDKQRTEFGRNCQTPDGLHYYCKTCAARRQRAWAKANADKVKQARADYLERIRAANAKRDPYAEPVAA